MRKNCEVLIHVDMEKALAGQIIWVIELRISVVVAFLNLLGSPVLDTSITAV